MRGQQGWNYFLPLLPTRLNLKINLNNIDFANLKATLRCATRNLYRLLKYPGYFGTISLKYNAEKLYKIKFMNNAGSFVLVVQH